MKTIYVSIPFVGKIYYQLANLLKKYDIRIRFFTSMLKHRLRHSLDGKKVAYNKSGLYNIKCNDCAQFYIGQTRRSLNTRFREHVNSQNKTVFGTAFKEAKRGILDIKHNMKILHKTEKGKRLDLT